MAVGCILQCHFLSMKLQKVIFKDANGFNRGNKSNIFCLVRLIFLSGDFHVSLISPFLKMFSYFFL